MSSVQGKRVQPSASTEGAPEAGHADVRVELPGQAAGLPAGRVDAAELHQPAVCQVHLRGIRRGHAPSQLVSTPLRPKLARVMLSWVHGACVPTPMWWRRPGRRLSYKRSNRHLAHIVLPHCRQVSIRLC